MDIEQQLRTAFARCEPRPELRAGILARTSALGESTRRNTRPGIGTILIGTVLVVAAAAMLAMKFAGPGNEPTTGVAAPVPVLTAAVQPVIPDPPVEIAPGSAKLPKLFTVHMLPLRHKTDDPLALAHVQRYYEKLLEGLRAVPDIALLGPEAANAADARPDMRIAVTTQAVSRFELPAGMSIPAGMSTAQWSAAVEIVTLPRKDIAPAATGYDGALIEPGCLPELRQRPETQPCGYEATAAAATRRIESLRINFFPDRSFAREVQARLKAQMNDPALDLPARLNAFARLVEMSGAGVDANTHEGVRARRLADLGHGANLEWDAEMVRGALDLLAAADPELRLQILRMLGGIKHPDLVPALIALLQTQTDRALVEEAARILAVDFSGDPMAQAALASMAGDSSQNMRQLSERAQSGDDAWRVRVSSTVMDTSLPTAERLRPAIEMLDFFSHDDALAVLGKKEMVMELVKLLPEFWSSNQETLLQNKSLELLRTLDYFSGGSRQDVNDAVIDLNVDALRSSSDSQIRRAATEWLGVWAINLPRVLQALEYVAANDPNPGVKNAAIGHIERTAPCREQPAVCAPPISAEAMVANNDQNKDGVVTREEAARANLRLIREWDTYDTNRDGKVGAAEINEALLARSRTAPAATAAPPAPVATPTASQ